MRRNFRTYQLSVQFYHATANVGLPRHLREQLQRAASSIVLNLAEGSGRPTHKEQRRFFDIAFGSLRECQAILDLNNAFSSEVHELADSLAAHLFNLIQHVKARQ